MSRITVEDCLARIEGYFELAHIASKRAVQLSSGSPSLISKSEDMQERNSAKKEKVTVTALREIADGLVNKEFFEQDFENQPNLPLDVADWIKEAREKNQLQAQEDKY